jgi:hypothetical protein
MEKKRTGRVGRRERRDSRICNALSGGKASFCTLAAAMRNGSPIMKLRRYGTTVNTSDGAACSKGNKGWSCDLSNDVAESLPKGHITLN